MHLMDTAGQEDYAELRVLGHANTNCFIVSFSVADKVDFLKDLNFRSGIQTKSKYLAILIKIRTSISIFITQPKKTKRVRMHL